MLTLKLNLDGSNPNNIKTRTYPILTGLTADQGGVYIPEHGVFLRSGLVVKHVDTGTILNVNRDYYLTYWSRHLDANYGIDGYGGIVLTNKSLTGNLEITTNHVGGGYVRFNPTYVKDVVNLIHGVPEQLFWDMVLDAPSTAHPNEHDLPAANISTGYEDKVSVLWMLVDRIESLTALRAADSIPPGTVMETLATSSFFSGNKYWLYMEGQTITRVEYVELFIALAIPHGTDSYVMPNKPNHIIRVR